MRNLLMTFVAVGAVLYGAACGNSDQTPEKLCEMMVDCGTATDQDTCLGSVGSLVLSEDCLDEMFAASCEEHNADVPPYITTCFDSCTTAGSHCLGDYLYVCNGTLEMVGDCNRICRYQLDARYSNVCGETGPNGEVSDSGVVCWCQID